MTIASGTRLGRYEIISSLGAGGMGEVYLANDTKLDRKVALKILPQEVAEEADRMRRFVREAKSTSALNHPNIITIHEIGEADGIHFIATEFIDGMTLSEYAKANYLNYKAVLEIAIQVASALDEAHTAGIVHRDIKPDNLMIRANGLVKILDFGIAKLSTPTSTDGEAATAIKSGTSAGMIIGTANYMSPEQAAGKEVDARSDIFSFGVLVYEMIAGRLPFAGETPIETIGAILKDEPLPLNANVPKEIQKIISKCLRKDRAGRYQTSKNVLIDLKDAQKNLEAQNKSERSVSPEQEEKQTQILPAATADEMHRTTKNQTARGKPTKKYLAIGLLSLLLAVGGFFGFKYFSPTSPTFNSIAVLPFENKSSDPDTDYLSDGLAESLIYRLSQIPDLKVSPTSSVFRYKGKATDPQIVAKELGVDSVLTGRITQRGDNLNISVNLVDTRNGKSLWGEQYERKMSELLATQKEIAAEITDNLKLKLSGESEQNLAKRYTGNNEAYQLYLKGNYHFARRTRADVLKAIDYFEQAIKLDPNFALAYVGVADSYNSLVKGADLLPKEATPQAKAAANKALTIDSTLAAAHAALADVLAIEWNWTEAEKEFKKAIELDPNVSYTHVAYGSSYLLPMGRADEAVTELKRSVELEPLSLINNAVLVSGYLYARQNDKALEHAKKTYDLDPNFRFSQQWLGQSYIAGGQYAEAATFAEKALQAFPFAQDSLPIAGQAYAKSGRPREAEQTIAKLKEMAKTQTVRHYWIAAIYAALGDKDNAFAELEQAYREHDWFLPRLKVDPIFDSLHNDPRYKDLLKRMNLPE